MPDPRVSVILPVYNASCFVRAAADSVLSQSWTDLELIIIDDGSSDDTARELEGIYDPRTLLLGQEHKGPAAARNAGLGRARGSYVAFMDADDEWLPGKLEQDVAYLHAHPEADLVFSSMRLVDEEGRDLGRTIRRWSGVLSLRDLLIENRIGSDTVLMRREACLAAGCFDERLPAASDYDYWLRVALLRPGNLQGLARVTALYRRHRGQISGDWNRLGCGWERIMAKMRARCPAEAAAVERLSRANFDRYLAAVAYENGDLGSAVRLFRQALQSAPAYLVRDRRTWLLGAALLASRVLPRALLHRLEGLVRTTRAYRP